MSTIVLILAGVSVILVFLMLLGFVCANVLNVVNGGSLLSTHYVDCWLQAHYRWVPNESGRHLNIPSWHYPLLIPVVCWLVTYAETRLLVFNYRYGTEHGPRFFQSWLLRRYYPDQFGRVTVTFLALLTLRCQATRPVF